MPKDYLLAFRLTNKLLKCILAILGIQPFIVVFCPSPEIVVSSNRHKNEQELALYAASRVEDRVSKHPLEWVLRVWGNTISHRVLVRRGLPPWA